MDRSRVKVKATVIILFALCVEVTPRALEEYGWTPLEIVTEPIQTSHGGTFEVKNPIVENLLINAIKSSAAMISQIEGINKYAIMLNTAKKKKVDVQLLPVNRNILIESPILDPSTIHNEVESILKKRQENSKKFMEAFKNTNNTTAHECDCNKTLKANEDFSNHGSLEPNVIHKKNDDLFQLQPEVRALNAFTKLTEFEQSYSEQNSENASSNKVEKFVDNLPQKDTNASISTINNKNNASQNSNIENGVQKSNGVLVKVNKINISNNNKARSAIKQTVKSDISTSATREEEKENYPDPALFIKAVKTVSHRFQSHSIPAFLLEQETETETEIPTSTIFEESEITTLNPIKSSKSLTAKIGGFLREDSKNSQFDLGNIKIVSSENKNDKTSKKLEDSKQSESSTKGGTLRKVTKVIKQPIRTFAQSVNIITTPSSNSYTEQISTQTNGFGRTSIRIQSSTISPVTYVKSSTKSANREENSRHSVHAGFLNISDTNLEINVQHSNTFNSQSKNVNENNLHKESLLRDSSDRFRLQKKENANTTPAPKISTKTIVNPVTFDIKTKGVDKNINNSLIYQRGSQKYIPSKFETISPFVSDSQVKQIYSEIGVIPNLPPNPELDLERGPLRHINFTRQNNEIAESADNSVRINRTNINRNPNTFRTNQESLSTTSFEYPSRTSGQSNTQSTNANSNNANRGSNRGVTSSNTIGSTSSLASSSRATGQFNQNSNVATSDSTRSVNTNRGNNLGQTSSNSNQESGSTPSYAFSYGSTGQLNSKPNYINSDTVRNVNSNRGNNQGYVSSDANKEYGSTTGFTSSRTTGQFSSKFNGVNASSSENINANTGNKINQLSSNASQASGSTFGTAFKGTGEFNSKTNDINSGSRGNVNTNGGISGGQISLDGNQASGSTFGTSRGTGQFNTKIIDDNSGGAGNVNTNRGINGGQISSNTNQASGSTFGTAFRGTGEFNTKTNDINSGIAGNVNTNRGINDGQISSNANQVSGSTFGSSSRGTGQFNTKLIGDNSGSAGNVNTNRGINAGSISSNANQTSGSTFGTSSRGTGLLNTKTIDDNSGSAGNVNTNRGVNAGFISSNANQASGSTFGTSSRGTGEFNTKTNDINSGSAGNVNTNRGVNASLISSNANQASGSTFGTSSRGTEHNSGSDVKASGGIAGGQVSLNSNQGLGSTASFESSSKATGQFGIKSNDLNSGSVQNVNANRGIGQGFVSSNINKEFGSTSSFSSSSKTTGLINSNANDVNSNSTRNSNSNSGSISSDLNKESTTISSFASSSRTTGRLSSQSNDVNSASTRNVNTNRGPKEGDIYLNANQEFGHTSNFESTGQINTNLNYVNSDSVRNVNRGNILGYVSSDLNRSKSTQNPSSSYNFELNSGTELKNQIKSEIASQKNNNFNATNIESTDKKANSNIINTKLNVQTTAGSQGSYDAKNQANIGQPGFVTPQNSIIGFASTSGPDSTKFEITTKSNSYSDGSTNGIASSLRSGNSRITTRPYFNPGESGFGTITQAGKSASSDNDDINKNASSSLGANVHQYNLELGNKHRGDDSTQNLHQKDNSTEAASRLSKTKVNSNNAIGIDDSVLINVPSSIGGGIIAGSANTRNVNGQSGFSSTTLNSIGSANSNRNVLQTIDSTIKSYTTQKIPKSNGENLQNKLKSTGTENTGLLINNGLTSNTNVRENSSRYNLSNKSTSSSRQIQHNKDQQSSLDLQHGASSNDKLASSFVAAHGEPFSISDDKERGAKKFIPSRFDTISPFLTDSNINKLYGDSQKPRFESNGKSNTIEFDDGKLTVGQEYGNNGVATSTKTQYRGSVKYHPSYVDWNYGDNDFPSQFSYNYNTHTGISAFQKGTLKEINNQKVFIIRGSYQYTAPDGSPIVVNYTADENGFHPEEFKPEVAQEFDETTEELETTNLQDA
ncbi:uncharacterized protein LOC143922918 isoform X2 [Arctopsyche grandis]|uniref:uncharacterized protein LOC143922918 isoform X2 n=1 Tax=Arctopsyche grandis TaxID=121162 RepID=UPI00406DA066